MKISSQPFGRYTFPSDYEVVHIATLNKTDLTGGNNKFYHIEGHASKDGKKFRLYSRYGRVGASGVEEERIPSDQTPEALEAAFHYLKKEKTSKRKGYVEVKLASSKIGSSVANQKILSDDVKKDNVKVDTKNDSGITLEPSVRTLVERLYAEAGKAVRSQLSGTLKTSTENPLGTLTLSQISEGRDILQEIQKLLSKEPDLIDSIDNRLLDLSNKFYSAIPQTMEKRPRPTEGKKRMDTWLGKMALNNKDILDDKEDLLELLSDVKGMVGGFATTDVGKKYLEIGCEYIPIPKSDSAFDKVGKFMASTRSKHHSWSSRMVNLWEVRIQGQKKQNLSTMKEIGNVKPLFHGSRNANILGICKRGLLLRPPGVYITGSMFGNGLYFADKSSKSEQYSGGRISGRSGIGNTNFMFIADVALGKIKKYQHAQTHLQKAPSGYHSVQGEKGSYLLHNEFIIYNIKQHILQYLIEFKQSGGYW